MVYSRFKFLVEDYHLEVAEKSVVYGQIDDFFTLISVQPQSNLFYIMLGAHPGTDAGSIEPFFKEIEDLPTIQSVEQEAATIVITGKVTLKKKKMLQAIRQILDTFPSKLHELGYHAGDFRTGINDGTVRLSQFNEYYTFLSEENYHLALDELDEQKSYFAQKKENMLFGLIGAFLGAALGGLLWFGIGLLGFYAWVAGILGLFLAFKGYQWFGGKVSKLGAVLVFLIAISLVFIANHALWAWTVNDGYDDMFWYTFANILPVIFSHSDIRLNYLLDVGLGIGVIALIGIPYTKSMYTQNASEYKVKRF